MPATTREPSLARSRFALNVSGFPRLVAVLMVAAGIGGSQSVANDRDAANIAVSSAHGLPAPPATVQESLIPVLPGGVVGPELDAGNGHAPKAAALDTARQPAGDTMPGDRQATLVPPPAETWDQAAESRSHLLGQEKPREVDGERTQQQRIGIGIGLAGIIGILAVIAAVRGGNQRRLPSAPMSIFRDLHVGARRP